MTDWAMNNKCAIGIASEMKTESYHKSISKSMLLLWSFGINNEYALISIFSRPNRIVYFVPWNLSIQGFEFFSFSLHEKQFLTKKKHLFSPSDSIFSRNFRLKMRLKSKNDKETTFSTENQKWENFDEILSALPSLDFAPNRYTLGGDCKSLCQL